MIDESLASRTFSLEDQQTFARLSADLNPLHLDEGFARRTQAGALVVHGVHALLWAMDAVVGSGRRLEIRNIKARFLKPLFVGESAEARIRKQSEASVLIDIFAEGALTTSVTVSPKAKARGNVTPLSSVARLERVTKPNDFTFEEMANRVGAVSTNASDHELQRLFPALCTSIGAARVKALLGASQIVGMSCPGLHSLFAGLDVACIPMVEREGVLSFEVGKTDARFRSLTIAVTGSGVVGELEAFARLPPPVQPTMEAVASRVSKGMFDGQKVLVVGGSRGLGEVAAKIIAAGGGHPTITFKEGRAAALAIAEEIRNAGGRCDVLRYDVLLSASDQLQAMEALPEYCYYFATRKIFERKSDLYEGRKFREFLLYYVDGFYDLCRLLADGRPDNISVFYPSTVAIDQSVDTVAEYAMAKAAGEILGKYIGDFLPNIRVICRRLPRISTDQTAVVGVVAAQDALDVMLPVVLEVQSR